MRPAGGPGRDPQPTLDDLTDLVLAERRAGRSVTLDITSDRRDLPRGLALSAYRIVQEALTNVRRHAGEASVVVRVLVTATALEIEVADDGMVQSLEGHDPGYGLAGMRERATMVGGKLSAGPAPGCGFLLTADLPTARAEL